MSLLSALPGVPRSWSEDRGSMAMALLLTVVGMSLAALMVPMTLVQMDMSRFAVQQSRSLHAAQAGIDVAVGQLRAARNADGEGVREYLPCGNGPSGGPVTQFSGDVGGGTGSYLVEVHYLTLSPLGHDLAWVRANTLAETSSECPLSVTPKYALLRSSGWETDRVHHRAIEATYTFQTTNENIAGGRIRAWLDELDLCFDAGSDSPAAGTNLRTQPCRTGAGQQRFAYNKNLTVSLVSSQSPTNPLGMCLDAGSPQVLGALVQLQPCGSTTRPQQQWSLNDASAFHSNGLPAPNAFCFWQQAPHDPSGSFVALGDRCGFQHNVNNGFRPEAAVGAGAAGESTRQLVNFEQFGRCLDVRAFDISTPFLIAWPCKQAADPADIGWNQRWTLPGTPSSATATGPVQVRSTLCLVSPRSTASGQYPILATCPSSGGLPANMTWTVNRDTGDYQTSYTLVDSAGYCLAPTDPNAPNPDLDGGSRRISKIKVEVCDGGTLQKWNAPPNVLRSIPLTDFEED